MVAARSPRQAHLRPRRRRLNRARHLLIQFTTTGPTSGPAFSFCVGVPSSAPRATASPRPRRPCPRMLPRRTAAVEKVLIKTFPQRAAFRGQRRRARNACEQRRAQTHARPTDPGVHQDSSIWRGEELHRLRAGGAMRAWNGAIQVETGPSALGLREYNKRKPFRCSCTRPACRRARRCSDTAGLVMRKWDARSPGVRSPPRSKSSIRRRAGCAMARNTSGLLNGLLMDKVLIKTFQYCKLHHRPGESLASWLVRPGVGRPIVLSPGAVLSSRRWYCRYRLARSVSRFAFFIVLRVPFGARSSSRCTFVIAQRSVSPGCRSVTHVARRGMRRSPPARAIPSQRVIMTTESSATSTCRLRSQHPRS